MPQGILPYKYEEEKSASGMTSYAGLPGMDCLPFQTITFESTRYKLFGIATNMNWEGGKLIRWQHERCGKSEEAHSVMKEDLAGGKLPSGDFGENAAWWSIMVLAYNLNTAMKNLILKGSWVTKRMKAIRFHLINLPGRTCASCMALFLTVLPAVVRPEVRSERGGLSANR